MSADEGLYQSYILRMWRESAEGEWRASLQDIPSCEMHHFPSLKALLQYLCNTGQITSLGGNGHNLLENLCHE
jgi:hypothetical protein